jgi:hypothetical protein
MHAATTVGKDDQVSGKALPLSTNSFTCRKPGDETNLNPFPPAFLSPGGASSGSIQPETRMKRDAMEGTCLGCK